MKTITATISPFGLSYNSFILKGMEAKWIIPQLAARPKVILFAKINEVLVNTPKLSDTLISFAVINTGIPALSVAYHYNLKECFSGALKNVESAYDWLLGEGYEPQDILLACDSTGGRLTSELLSIFEKKGKKPWGGLLLYPEPKKAIRNTSFIPINNLRGHFGY